MSTAKVMIVEDNTTVAKDLHGCLLELGYEVTSIQVSGEEAIEKARFENPDIAIMDIHLRDKMNGLEAAELIHEELGIPIVILSAFDDKALLEKAKKVIAAGQVIQRNLETADLTGTIVYLASDNSAFVTGQTHMVDGGSWFL